MIRGHQFNKVEMVQYTTEDGSDAAFEELVGKEMCIRDRRKGSDQLPYRGIRRCGRHQGSG